MLGVPMGLIGGCVGKNGTPLMGGSSTLGTERRSELKQFPILSAQLSVRDSQECQLSFFIRHHAHPVQE